MPRRYEEDEEYDDEPQPRKRRRRDDDERPQAKSNTKLILGIIAGVFGVFFLICSGLIFMVYRTTQKAVTAVQQAAQNSMEQNNLKMVGIAIHSDSDTSGKGLAAPFAVDKTGKPLPNLSFRVSLLPYIEQDSLYRSFDLTKAWDDPKNMPYSSTAIRTYAPLNGTNPPTHTNMRVFHGGGALFNSDGKPVPFGAITDGTSNTIMIVTTTETVPWAKPQELPYSKTTALPSFAKTTTGKYVVLMADGSTRLINPTINEQVLRNAIERADGNVIIWDN